jgi:hypothetical protein
MGKNKQPSKEGGIKIIDPRRIDYTYRSDGNIKSSLDIKKNIQNNGSSKKPKTKKIFSEYDIILQGMQRSDTKERMTGGQSMQGHSSVYE